MSGREEEEEEGGGEVQGRREGEEREGGMGVLLLPFLFPSFSHHSLPPPSLSSCLLGTVLTARRTQPR